MDGPPPTWDRDYIAPGLVSIFPDAAFPNMMVGNKSACLWPWLRRDVPHHWYVDRREPTIGFLNRDEVHILFNTALRFRNQPALEIGCWLGWSACHLALAGVRLDVIDPVLDNPVWLASVTNSLTAAGVADSVNLVAGASPQAVHDLAARTERKWALCFIDGNHEDHHPFEDAVACAAHAADNALVLFHDLVSPHVARGLDFFRTQGWHTMLYQTMQIMGVAWRGNVKPIEHVPDPSVRWSLPGHLSQYAVSGWNAESRSAEDVHARFFQDLVAKTENFSTVKWLGQPIWQNILDLWTIQETISEVRPSLLIECGTNRGGSALFYAHLFDLMGQGRVVSIDIDKMHTLSHPRITFLLGSSLDPRIIALVHVEAAKEPGPIMVILDSDHAAAHVLAEMEAYGGCVTPGSFMLVQDGVMDIVANLRGPGPGPLHAIREFLPRHPEFAVDEERCGRFLVTHHPSGWLRRGFFV